MRGQGEPARNDSIQLQYRDRNPSPAVIDSDNHLPSRPALKSPESRTDLTVNRHVVCQQRSKLNIALTGPQRANTLPFQEQGPHAMV